MANLDLVSAGQRTRAGLDPVVTEYILSTIKYDQEALWNQLIPQFTMSSDAGTFKKLNHDIIRVPTKLDNHHWEPGQVPHKITWATTTDTFALEQYALSIDWNKDEMDSSVFGALAPRGKLIKLQNYINTLLNKELVSAMTDTNFFTNTTTLGSALRWDNYTSITSDPAANHMTAALTIYEATGLMPSLAIYPYKVAVKLAAHPAVKAYVATKYPGLSEEWTLPPVLWGWPTKVVKNFYEGGQMGQSAQTLTQTFGTTVCFLAWQRGDLNNMSIDTFVGPLALLKRQSNVVEMKSPVYLEREEVYVQDGHIRRLQFKKFNAGCNYVYKTVIS